ncbi:MAG: DUF167 domain-containing protein [Parvularculaceae bacterium]
MGAAFETKGETVILRLRVTPNASADKVGGCWNGPGGDVRLAMRVTAPPDKGRANKAAVRLLAKTLGLPKSAVSITAGETDRLKTVALKGDPGNLTKRLDALLGGVE